MVKRLASITVIGLVVVGIMALALLLTAESALAQGPGGNGRGRGGAGNGAGGYGAGGNGTQTQQQLHIDDPLSLYTQTQTQYGAQTGTGYGTGGNGPGGNGAGNINQAANQNMINGLLATLPPAVPGELPADVVAALNAALHDEQNAYATYQAVIDQFGAVRPFTSIQAAEAQHIAALEFLFERYGLTVPQATPVQAAAFASVSDACSAGAAAEIANFALYDNWMATVANYPDILQVITALRDASEFQHLPAFERCAS